MNTLIRLTLFFSAILLFVLGLWFVSDHQRDNDLATDSDKTLMSAMNETMAEDLSFTIQLFLHQVEDDLVQWQAEENGGNSSFQKELIREVEQHPHIHGFGKYKDNKSELIVGEMHQDFHTHLSRKNDAGLLLSDPFIKQGTKRMIVGSKGTDSLYAVEVDLSFIEGFVKDMASLSDTNGQFFIGDGEMDVALSDEEADLPYVKEEVPDIGWSIYVQGDDTKQIDVEHFKKGEVIVELHQSVDKELWAKENNVTIIDEFNSKIIVRDTVRTTEEIMNTLDRDPFVQFMEPNYTYSKQGYHQQRISRRRKIKNPNFSTFEQQTMPNDEFYEAYQWNFFQISAEEGWAYTTGDEAVPIAIIDSGVDSEHIDLANRIQDGYNAFENNNAYQDEHGHGTHVAGVAAAITNNEDGVAGISWDNPILAIKVLDHNAEGNSLSIAKGIVWAVDNGAKVINLSLGDSHHSDMMYEAIRYAYEQDVVLVAASGNDNVETPMYPAAYKEVLAVAAVDPFQERAFFSNYGNHIDVSAPGEHIASTFPGNQYVVMSGTSMASPHVAGMAGLIRSVNPSLSNEQVYELIRHTSNDLGETGYDPFYGYGEINIKGALEEITLN